MSQPDADRIANLQYENMALATERDELRTTMVELVTAFKAVLTYPGVSELFADRGSLGSLLTVSDRALAHAKKVLR